MKFLLLCCFEDKRWVGLAPAERDGIMRDYGEWVRAYTASGHHLAGAQLQPAATAKTLRNGKGRPAVTDGPFAETKEQLGGYHLMECDNLAEALEIAQRIPTIPFGGSVEVRALEPVPRA